MLVPGQVGSVDRPRGVEQGKRLDDDQQGPIKRSRDEILHDLAQFPIEFKRVIIDPNNRAALLRPAFDGGWGIVEILPHLKDWEQIYFERASKILSEDEPHLTSFDDTLWSIERDYRGQDPYEALADLGELRRQLVELLTNATPSEWQRTAIHGYYGQITLHWMADHICDHDAEHLQQARDALVG
jgi:hypothetical protein